MAQETFHSIPSLSVCLRVWHCLKSLLLASLVLKSHSSLFETVIGFSALIVKVNTGIERH